MAKIFLSHQFTKEDKVVLRALLTKVVNALSENGHDIFCSTLRQDEINSHNIFTYEERLAYCLERQKESDCILAIHLSENPSTGMSKELELAKQLSQQYILFTKQELPFAEFKEYASKVIHYTNHEELITLISEHFK